MVLFSGKKVKIAAQIQAESDQFLFSCFHDSGVIEKLVDNRFELIAGRKGTGKTAIARYLQKEHENYGIDFAARLTLTDLQSTSGNVKVDSENLLKFLAVATAQRLLKKELLNSVGVEFWSSYLMRHGLQDVSNYSDWILKAKQVIEKKGAGIGIKSVAGASLSHDKSLEYEKQFINESTSTLLSRLSESIEEDKKVIVIIDDITDQFDNPDNVDVRASMDQIKYILHQLHNYNTKFTDDGVDLTFICTIRDDLWEFILGSNENKLIHNCLWLEWDERSFCELLIKRLPHFSDRLDEALANPFESIKTVFPDEIFEEALTAKKVKPEEIKHYKTKFYSYVQLISFNRPRDFLRLCYAMKPRLSEIKPVELKHIHATELEYSDYFHNELRDELNIFSKILNVEVATLLNLMSRLAEKPRMSYTEFKSILANYLKASHSKTSKFISLLWDYSLLGLMANGGRDYAHFRHSQGRNNGYDFPREDQLKQYYFLLHRGLYWKYHPTQSS